LNVDKITIKSIMIAPNEASPRKPRRSNTALEGNVQALDGHIVKKR